MPEQKINPVLPVTGTGNVLKKEKQAGKNKPLHKPDQVNKKSRQRKSIIDTYA